MLTTKSLLTCFIVSHKIINRLCCGYGEGNYAVKYNAIQVAAGAVFGSNEDATFGLPSCTQIEAIAPPTVDDMVLIESMVDDGASLEGLALTRSMPVPTIDAAPEPQEVDCESLLEKYCLAASPRCTWRSSGQNEGCHASNEDI